MAKVLVAGLLASATVWGCSVAPSASTPAPGATGPTGALVHYRCDNQIDFTVRFVDDSALLDSAARGNEVLLRDAGGLTPQQTVYSNPRLRAEFGLGTTGREAILRYLSPQLVAQCVRD